MKKILFGAILAAGAFYYFHPEQGAARRERLSNLWGSRKDTVLEAARTTSSVVAGVSQDVGDLVGSKIGELRTDGETTNGALTAAASTHSSDS
jgi:hypothetical protein